MKKLEYIEKYGEEAYNKRLERIKLWQQNNKLKRKKTIDKYNSSHKEEYAEWRKNHKEELKEYGKNYYQNNKEKYHTYAHTPQGRATKLIWHYNKRDNGECTLTSKWIVDNIFNSKCIYCGETDWTKLGCDRIDNTKPHTPSNVVCSCYKCNVERNINSFEKFMEKKEISIY